MSSEENKVTAGFGDIQGFMTESIHMMFHFDKFRADNAELIARKLALAAQTEADKEADKEAGTLIATLGGLRMYSRNGLLMLMVGERITAIESRNDELHEADTA